MAHRRFAAVRIARLILLEHMDSGTILSRKGLLDKTGTAANSTIRLPTQLES